MPLLPPVKRFVSAGGVRVYQIACQVFPTMSGRVYLLLGAGVPTLVDTGSGLGHCTRDILRGLDEVGRRHGDSFRPRDVRRIIITHAHIDHFGGLEELLGELKAEVAAHPLACRPLVAYEEYTAVTNRRLDDFLREAGVVPDRREKLVRAFGLERGRFSRTPVGLSLADNQDLDGLRILHTPGHASGLVCIAVDNVLLCADLILARTIPQQWPESMGAYVGLGHYFDSLERIQALPGFDLALGGHELPMHDVYHRIALIRDGIQRRLDRLLELVRGDHRPLSVGEITSRLYGDGVDFRAVLQVTDVGARVEYLHQRGQLLAANLDEIRDNERPVFRYAARP